MLELLGWGFLGVVIGFSCELPSFTSGVTIFSHVSRMAFTVILVMLGVLINVWMGLTPTALACYGIGICVVYHLFTVPNIQRLIKEKSDER